MVQEGQLQNELLDIKNVEFNIGNVEKIAFKNNTFDLVISRFAFHHFLDPEKVLNEMFRVSTGTVSIIDMISSEDSYASKLYNLHEKLRDPSHTLALKETDFLQMFKQAGLEITHSEIIEVDINVNRWLNLAKTNKDIAGKIINRIHNEIRSGELITGLYPFKRNNELFFKQRWLQIIGNK
jgi:ubiquinone/menaquinone biosynthesis C-methylase UbiE